MADGNGSKWRRDSKSNTITISLREVILIRDFGEAAVNFGLSKKNFMFEGLDTAKFKFCVDNHD